jgi:hypothetical protein
MVPFAKRGGLKRNNGPNRMAVTGRFLLADQKVPSQTARISVSDAGWKASRIAARLGLPESHFPVIFNSPRCPSHYAVLTARVT